MHNAHKIVVLAALATMVGCASVPRSAELAPLALAGTLPAPVPEDHFGRDAAGGLTPAQLQELLHGPVYLESGARLGVVAVEGGYEPGSALPLPSVPAELVKSLEGSGEFELATEVTTDWPTDRGVGGLRELAARYRAPYLLLYRQRFVDDSYANAWAITFPTIIGALVTPNQTLETDGVLEATLFDVQSGTLLFTVFERVHDSQIATVWHDDRKVAAMQRALQTKAARALADQVLEKIRRLAALRPKPKQQETASLPTS